MFSTKLASIGLAASLVAILPAVSAQAQVNRTFVSAAGSDSNNCANVTTPCRHFAAAYAATAPRGEIFVLDPANYGSLTITHAVSIQGHGWASIAPPNNGNAITINAGPGDSISIHGVAIDGTGATGGTSGIVFNSGGSLTVSDCVVQNFVIGGSPISGIGVLIAPTSGTVEFTITNTTASNNGYVGIAYFPQSGTATAHGVIDHAVANSNQFGIAISSFLTTGGSTFVTVSNSIASNNTTDGFQFAEPASGLMPLKASVDNVTASSNGTGIHGINSVSLLVGRSVVTDNTTGVHLDNFGSVSYQDNRIDFNVTDIGGVALTSGTPGTQR